jgi:hypothetical protein
MVFGHGPEGICLLRPLLATVLFLAHTLPNPNPRFIFPVIKRKYLVQISRVGIRPNHSARLRRGRQTARILQAKQLD